MIKLMVVCGGQSSEHVVSRMSATSVIKNLNQDKYQITKVGITQEGKWFKLDDTIEDVTVSMWLDGASEIHDLQNFIEEHDVIFPVLHGKNGEDGSIQGLFELTGVPYVGCRVLSASTSMDKIYTKKILDSASIPQVPSVYIKKKYDGKLVAVSNDFEEYVDVVAYIKEKLGFPCFIKASNSGSSVGCYKVNEEALLMEKLIDASQYDRKIVVEKCVDCIELECAVLGNDDLIVSRVGQIMPHGEFYTFESKYEDQESKTCIPAKVDETIQEKIRHYALKVFKAMDCHGLARIDFFLDKQTNEIYLNELNTMPGFTNISMYPQLIMDLGITYDELLDQLITLACQR